MSAPDYLQVCQCADADVARSTEASELRTDANTMQAIARQDAIAIHRPGRARSAKDKSATLVRPLACSNELRTPAQK